MVSKIDEIAVNKKATEKNANIGRVGDVLLRPIDAINSELDKQFLKDDIKHFATRMEDYNRIFNPPSANLTANKIDDSVALPGNNLNVDDLNKMSLGDSAGKLDEKTKSKLDEILLNKTASGLGLAEIAGGTLLGGTAYAYAKNKARHAEELKMQEDADNALKARRHDEWNRTLDEMRHGPAYKRIRDKAAGFSTPGTEAKDYAAGVVPGAILGGVLGGPVGALAGGGAGALTISALRDPVASEQDINRIMNERLDANKAKLRELENKNKVLQQLAAEGYINQENMPRVLGALK